jgi:glutamate/tyrosine decarboxylase-like PLP-dependent enzyme
MITLTPMPACDNVGAMSTSERHAPEPGPIHGWNDDIERLSQGIVDYARDRLRLDPVPLDRPHSFAELQAQVGSTITPEGLGGEATLRIFTEILAPACLSIDHPRYLSFIPCAPTEASMLFDLVVGASSIYGGSWLEGSGAVFAENQAHAWLAELAGLPPGAGGVFVQGGTIGNLSALVAARHRARTRRAADAARAGPPERSQPKWAVAASSEAHSSIKSAASVMDVEVIMVDVGEQGRFDGPALDRALSSLEPGSGLELFAVVASAGTTNLGIVDDLASLAESAARHGAWFHVDGAYGGAALAAPSVRAKFAGIEHADSFVVDPHKWLFAPFDCAALVYRDPEEGRAAHAQHASYLEPLQETGNWNPSDFAVQLTRRARGLPFWFSLATFGTAAYSAAIERTLAVARHAARSIAASPRLELLNEPDLSVVCFRRVGWDRADYYAWSDRLLTEGLGFVTPTTVRGEAVARFAVVNPVTTEDDIDQLLDTMN